jgi:hypothetical protein
MVSERLSGQADQETTLTVGQTASQPVITRLTRARTEPPYWTARCRFAGHRSGLTDQVVLRQAHGRH